MKLCELFNPHQLNEEAKVVGAPSLQQLFRQNKFVPYLWTSEYSHECEVAVLTDIPANITPDKVKQLCAVYFQNAYQAEDAADNILSINSLEQAMTRYDPGMQISGPRGVGRFKIHTLTFKEYAAYLQGVFDNEDGEDVFDDDLDTDR